MLLHVAGSPSLLWRDTMPLHVHTTFLNFTHPSVDFGGSHVLATVSGAVQMWELSQGSEAVPCLPTGPSLEHATC